MIYIRKFDEFVTLSDLSQSQGMSDFTRKWRSRRNKFIGSENKTSKLIDSIIDINDNSVTFNFLTSATEPEYPKDYSFKNTNPEMDFELENDESKTYQMNLKILNFFDWLDVFSDLNKITDKEIKEILKSSNIQVFCECPSFHWQSPNYYISQLDGSIYPTNIKPKVWNLKHGEDNAFVCKHLGGLINGIKFWYSPMASMITKKLKEMGIL